MTRHLVVVSLTDGSHAVLNKNPLEVAGGDEIRWTSNDGDIRVELPPDLLGLSPSEPPQVRYAEKEHITAPVAVIADVPGRGGRAWYRYDVFVGAVQANALPHVIVT
ncbi:MAG: hypothetical protein IT158_05240 [Bryobacterales bacterium]|nr:hypothetical protein [Bryobacterales bacterium]